MEQELSPEMGLYTLGLGFMMGFVVEGGERGGQRKGRAIIRFWYLSSALTTSNRHRRFQLGTPKANGQRLRKQRMEREEGVTEGMTIAHRATEQLETERKPGFTHAL